MGARSEIAARRAHELLVADCCAAAAMTAVVLTAGCFSLQTSCHFMERSDRRCNDGRQHTTVQPRQQFARPYLCATPTTQFRAVERRPPLERRALGARAPRSPRPGGAAAAPARHCAGGRRRRLGVRAALRARAVRRRAAVGAAARRVGVHPLRVDRRPARPAGRARRHGGRRDGGRRARRPLRSRERGRARLCRRRRARVLQGEFVLLPARRRARRAARRQRRAARSGMELRALSVRRGQRRSCGASPRCSPSRARSCAPS